MKQSKIDFMLIDDNHIVLIMDGQVYDRPNTDDDIMNELLSSIRLHNKRVDGKETHSDKSPDDIKNDIKKKVDPNYKSEIKFGTDIDEPITLEKNGQGELFLPGTDEPMPNFLVDRIISYEFKKLSIESLVNFWENTLLNPNERSRKDLFNFLASHHMPITTNGYFIAYKAVYKKNDEDFNKKITELYNKTVENEVKPEKIWIIKHSKDSDFTVHIGTPNKMKNQDFSEKTNFQKLVDENIYEEINFKALLSDWEHIWDKQTIKLVWSHTQEYAIANDILNKMQEYMGPFPTNRERFSAAWEELVEKEVYGDEDLVEPIPDYREIKRQEKEEDYDVIGNLKDLYDDIENGRELYTDKHSRTMTIQLGKTVKMPRDMCDEDPYHSCSYGLHVGNVDYVRSFHSGNGAILLCLVNPANVVAVPHTDATKMRTCEYYVYGITDLDEKGNIISIDVDHFEDDYQEVEREQIKKALESKDFSTYNEELSEDTIEAIMKKRLVKV